MEGALRTIGLGDKAAVLWSCLAAVMHLVWRGVVWYGVVWFGVLWCGVVWCGGVDKVVDGWNSS